MSRERADGDVEFDDRPVRGYDDGDELGWESLSAFARDRFESA